MIKSRLPRLTVTELLHKARDYMQLTIGAVIIAIAIDSFLIPNKVVSGGVTGMATILYLKLGWPVGTLVLLFNIPLFIMGYRYTGGLTFLLRSGYTVLVMSLAIDLLAPYVPHNISDPLLYTLFGGFLDGLGIGLVFRARGTTGGTDIVAKLLNRFTGLQLGQVILYVNTTVLLGAAILIGLQPALYALIVTFVIAQVVDTVQEGFGYARSAMIVSSKAEAVRDGLIRELHRGVTILQGRGGYTESEKEVLYCVVAKSEVSSLKRVVLEVDPAAFVVITEAHEVWGKGFKPVAAG
jgi:uncharacterized membrane-anchored protein YitT (DUF2179 family)